MKVSLNWARQLSGVTVKTEELIELIGRRLGEVDSVTDIGASYEGVTIVKVVQCQKHLNADKLHVCLVDDKKVIKGVKRDSRGFVQVVCGAPNIKAGMLAAWIPPGATVPSTFGKEPFILEAKELRGIVSNGMLASPKELGLGDSHEGLLELDTNAKAGASFAATYELDDVIIDIENKMFTHRPDCFGQLGVAREIAGITHKKFTSPGWYTSRNLSLKGRSALSLKVNNSIPDWVPRFCVVSLEGTKVGPSPVWLVSALSKLGVKPVNNVVDVTNYIMLLTGQPMHAYDYDKLNAGSLGVRMSKAGEELSLLGGKKLKLHEGAIVITSGQEPIGLGGIMGGQATEVDGSTKNIVLEAATFDMRITRKTAFDYGLFTEAATRFTKNQSKTQPPVALSRALELLHQLAGGQAGTMQDDPKYAPTASQVKTSADFINKRLGTALHAVEIKRLLENVEFKVTESGSQLKVSPPFWRTDIEIAEDVVEEVGRLYGYEHLPLQLPRRDISPQSPEPRLAFKSRLRAMLSAAGANEVLTYSFVSSELIEKARQNHRKAYRLSNPVSPEFEYYRLSLLPSLLEKIHPNIKLGYGQFAIYELGKGHSKNHPTDGDEKVPKEFNQLALVFAAQAKNDTSGSAYYQARSYLDYLGEKLGLEFDYEPVNAETNLEQAKPFALGRMALVAHRGSDTPIGIIGELHSNVSRNLKLPKYTSGFEIDIDALAKVALDSPAYKPINRFPGIDQDICLRLNEKILYKAAADCVERALTETSKTHGYSYRLRLLDIFQKTGAQHKQITWRVSLYHPSRTLITEEASKVLDKVATAAKRQLKAERV